MAVRKIRRYGSAVVQKGRWAKQQIAKRSAAILFVMIIVIGILLPAGTGLLLEKVSDVGVDTVYATSAVNNATGISLYAYYRDGTNRYKLDVVTMNGFNYYLVDKSNLDSADSNPKLVWNGVSFNSSYLDGLDKIHVQMKVVGRQAELNKSHLCIWYVKDCWRVAKDGIKMEYDNKTGFWVADIEITPDIYLKLVNAKQFGVDFYDDGQLKEGDTVQFRVDLINTKGISASTTKNMFLAGSGILMLIAGLCATPWLNPSKYLKKKRWF